MTTRLNDVSNENENPNPSAIEGNELCDQINLSQQVVHALPFDPSHTLGMLDQFKQLLIAFKKRQYEEIAASESRNQLILDLKAARLHIDELEKGNPSERLRADFYDLLEVENETLQEKSEFAHEQTLSLRSELDRVQEESLAYQEQICTIKNLLVGYQNELEALREYPDSFRQVNEETVNSGSVEASRQHAEQLERTILFLREKAEESHLETQQLQRELQASQDTINNYIEILSSAKSVEESLRVELEHEKNDRTEALQQAQTANNQFDILKTHLHNLQQELDHRLNNSDEEKNSREQLINENLKLAALLEKKDHAFQALERDVSAIKQNLIRGMREAKELESHYLEAVKEKVEAVSQFSQLQRTADKQRLELEKIKSHSKELEASYKNQQNHFEGQQAQLKNELRELQTSLTRYEMEDEASKKHIHDLEIKLTQAHSTIEDARMARQHMQAESFKQEKYAQEKEFMVKELLEKLMRLEEEKNQAYEELGACHHALEEKEQQFDEAQQHLAKKVREAAQFEAKIEEINEQAKISTAKYDSLDKRYVELELRLQKSLDEQVHLEQKSHLLSSEIEQWQSKYSQLEVKWETAKEQIEELQRIGERHQQLQHMVSSFGNILGLPLDAANDPLPAEKALPKIAVERIEPAPAAIPEAESNFLHADKTIFKSLFEANLNHAAPKRDLFD